MNSSAGGGLLELDELDKRLIHELQKDCRTPLGILARKLGTSKSTAHYRIKRLESEGVIEGYYAKVSASKLRKDYAAVVLTSAKPGVGMKERIRIGREIASIPGVWCVYGVFGEYDFIYLVRADTREDLSKKVNAVHTMRRIERTESQIVELLIKEDLRFEPEEMGLTDASRHAGRLRKDISRRRPQKVDNKLRPRTSDLEDIKS